MLDWQFRLGSGWVRLPGSRLAVRFKLSDIGLGCGFGVRGMGSLESYSGLGSGWAQTAGNRLQCVFACASPQHSADVFRGVSGHTRESLVRDCCFPAAEKPVTPKTKTQVTSYSQPTHSYKTNSPTPTSIAYDSIRQRIQKLYLWIRCPPARFWNVGASSESGNRRLSNFLCCLTSVSLQEFMRLL